MRSLSRFETACLVLVVGGIAARLTIFVYDAVFFDEASYVQMGASLARFGEFLRPWEDPVGYARHFPPLFPALLAGLFSVFGVSLTVAEFGTFLGALFFVGVVFACTNDLFGRTKAFAATALAITFPPLIAQDLFIHSESLVAAFFGLTIWAILKSIDKPAFIVLAGVFAALSYLTKASIGPFFILAAMGGFAWRFYFVRWRVFADKYYIAAGIIFASTVALWSWRNVTRFGWPNWETQPHATEAFVYLFTQSAWPVIIFQEILWSGVILGAIALPWWREIRASASDIRSQKTSALWLSVVTASVVAVLFVSAFFALENYPRVTTVTNVRYLITPIVPLFWLAMKGLEFPAEAPVTRPTTGAELVRRHRILVGVGVGILAIALALNPTMNVVSIGRIVALIGLILAGGIILAVSTLSLWTASPMKDKSGATSWRAVADGAAGRRAAAGMVILVGGILLGVFVWLGSLALTIPAAAQAFVNTPRQRVVIVAVLFLSAGLAGLEQRTAVDEIAAAVNAAAPSDATLTLGAGLIPEAIYPFLREDVKLKPGAENPDVTVILSEKVPEPPPGYHQVADLPITFAPGPGTWLGMKIETALNLDRPLPGGHALVYARNATS